MNFDKTTIDYNLYYNIWKARKAKGLITANEYLPHRKTDNFDSGTGLFDCSLVGAKIRSKTTRKVYTVEKVFVRYYFGWYVEVLFERNDSHGMVSWMVLSDFTKDQFLLDECSKRRSEYVLHKGTDITREEVVDYINKYCPQKIK